MTSILPALAGASIIYGMGMLEMGISMSYEQLIIDAEIVRMAKRVARGIDVNRSTLAEDVITKVGPAGTFLSQKHTRDYMRMELSQAALFDRNMYETWERNGARDIREVAREQAKERLKNHKVIPLDPAVEKQLRIIIKEAEEERKGGSS